MKFIFSIFFLLPAISQAHCPIEIHADHQDYCLDIQWQFGDKKIKGQMTESDKASPHLISMGEVPQKWIYSF